MSNDFRIETDAIGQLHIKDSKLYGIHTKRALENFHIDNQIISMSLMKSITLVKKACAHANLELEYLKPEIGQAIIKACDQVILAIEDPGFEGRQAIINALCTHPIQGGAGTSAHMNINEVIANLALIHLGHSPGQYQIIHPIDHVNLHQSTNDVFPTALKMTLIYGVRALSDQVARLQSALQESETTYANVLKLGRTQLMDAVPITFGQVFGAFARAISRDRWRIYKAEERLREINLGGTAVGTGLNTSIDFIYLTTDYLQKFSGLGLARADLLIDATQNADVYVEVSGLLKSLSTNLLKISNDLRLMNSGPVGGLNEINLEAHQAGSSIMPGKVNPVICEMINQICFKCIGADTTICLAASSGQLELNPYLPLIGHELLGAIDALTYAVKSLEEKCIRTLTVNEDQCAHQLMTSYAPAAAFIEILGYDTMSQIAKYTLREKITLKAGLLEKSNLTEAEIDEILKPSSLTQPKRS